MRAATRGSRTGDSIPHGDRKEDSHAFSRQALGDMRSEAFQANRVLSCPLKEGVVCLMSILYPCVAHSPCKAGMVSIWKLGGVI